MQTYIQQELDNKNRFIYFKNGRWILHLLYWIVVVVVGQKGIGHAYLNVEDFFGNFLFDNWMIAVFYFIYCLYLLPFYFKKNKYRQFWLILVIGMLVFAVVDLLLQSQCERFLPKLYQDGLTFTWKGYKRMLYMYFVNFVGFTTLLYFMELAEGYGTYQAIRNEMKAMASTRRQLVKTKMNPAFVMRSLDGITSLAEQKDGQAPNAVVQFAEVLRYRLYKSTRRLVPLQEELAHLHNLIQFHNSIYGSCGFCSLETEGDISNKSLPPLSLLNIVEPLMDTYKQGAGWSMIVYMLVSNNELEMAVELSNVPVDNNAAFDRAEHNIATMFASHATFEHGKENNNHSIRICLPLLPQLSTASL